MADDKQHYSKKFKFEISNLDDVVEHLDALWEAHNTLCKLTAQPTGCIDPPSCCGVDKLGHKDFSKN